PGADPWPATVGSARRADQRPLVRVAAPEASAHHGRAGEGVARAGARLPPRTAPPLSQPGAGRARARLRGRRGRARGGRARVQRRSGRPAGQGDRRPRRGRPRGGGRGGVERAFNGDLAGQPGKAIVGRDALGREVAAPHVLQQPKRGHGVMLTIDTTIQYIAEREVDAAYRRTHSKAAMAVVLDPRTGDVLAMAMRPTFNPNAFLDVPSSDAWRNRAVTDPFAPGSTFKVIMAAAALEEGVVRPEDRIYAENGAITLAGT